MSKALPSWTEGNFAHHHGKRIRENPGCCEDLLGITGRPVTVEDYRDRSVQAVTAAWCEHEAEGRDFGGGKGASLMHLVDCGHRERPGSVTAIHPVLDPGPPGSNWGAFRSAAGRAG